MRIVIVERNSVLKKNLINLIKDAKKYRLLGETDSIMEAQELVSKRMADVLIADTGSFDERGFNDLKLLKERNREVKILILSNSCDLYSIGRAFDSGASGFLLKTPALHELTQALESVISGQLFISSLLMPLFVENLVNSLPDTEKINKYRKLTKGERENLRLLMKGLKRNEIAEKLFVSVKTVDHHKANIKRKLKVKTDIELMEYAPFTEDNGIKPESVTESNYDNLLYLKDRQKTSKRVQEFSDEIVSF